MLLADRARAPPCRGRAAAFKSATEEGRDSRGVLTEHLKEAAEHIAHLKV